MVRDPVRLCLQPLYCFSRVRRATVQALPMLCDCVPCCVTVQALVILCSHCSLRHVCPSMCIAGGRCGKGCEVLVATQIN